MGVIHKQFIAQNTRVTLNFAIFSSNQSIIPIRTMSFYMSLTLRWIRERFQTYIALQRLLSGMYPLMYA